MIRDACYLDSIITFALCSAEFCNTIYPKADIKTRMYERPLLAEAVEKVA